MTSRRSTARSRDIGLELLAIREKAKLDGQGLANRLGWDQSKVSRIEGGKQAIDEIDLIHWLSTCGIKGTRLRQLVMRNREANKETWVVPIGHRPVRPTLIVEERQAKTITSYGCMLVPGLLQTPDYFRALAMLHNHDEATVERLLAVRMRRQEVLKGEKAPKTVFYIEEVALRRVVGDRRIMHEQLMHLMFMAGWTKVSIRVLPIERAHIAADGAILLIERYERRDTRWLALVNTGAATVIFEGDEHIARCKKAIADLDRVALSEEESRSFIAMLAGEPGRLR